MIAKSLFTDLNVDKENVKVQQHFKLIDCVLLNIRSKNFKK